MDHVSTLCALSTVGIAPTGLALGRVERCKSKILRRKTLLDEPPALPTPPLEATPVDVRPKTSRSARPSLAAVDWTINEKEPTAITGNIPRDPQLQEPDLRRASLSFGAARYRRRGQTLTNPPLRIPEHGPTEPPETTAESHSRRPSTSWLRRLSIVSFQSDSPTTNSPVTPSFTGSASPILSRPASQHRTPNKLVKRPSTRRSNGSVPLFVNTAVSPGSALRRPATSYQRSETMQAQTPITPDFETRFSQQFQPADSPAIEDFQFQSQDDWKSFWLPKREGFSEKLSRRLSTATAPKAQGMKCLISDQDTLPALISASTIINKTTPHRDEPAAPVEFRNPFQAQVETSGPLPASEAEPAPELEPDSEAAPRVAESAAALSPPLPQSPPQLHSPEKPTHKHSYSFNDLEPKRIVVNTVTATGAPIIGPRGGSLKRVKGRTFSIPRAELPRIERIKPTTSSVSTRRNITDPAVFRQPSGLASPASTGLAYSGQSAGLPRSVSHDYNLGLREYRPLTTDAVAISTWQHSKRPDSHAPSSLRRRPKRHSIAASDPASTIIGSDDTRVFTSGDEYETDLMTDYWDSIRTRGTEGSGLHGLRIETMFDKAGTQLSNEEVTTLEDLLPRGSFASRVEKDPPLFSDSLLASSVTGVRTNDELSFSDEENDSHSMIGALPGEQNGPPLQLATAFPLSSPLELSSPGSPSDILFGESRDERSLPSQKMNIFDWSEQTRPDRDQSDSEARPSTVHGKQNAIDRGSRAACRKVPSSIHLRSQSVPVARELPASDSRQTSGKFGTWGLGSKGVSEDWDSDFDFDDGEEEDAPSQKTKSTESEAPTQSMTVPQAILERQASLRGQYGQVQELTLLVEELKRLRHQASVLELVGGPSSELWKEAEGIVNLATIDDDDDRRSPPGSPSSLTFSFDDSDDEGLTVPSTKRDSDGSWRSAAKQETALPLRQQGVTMKDDQPYNAPLQQQLSNNSPKSKSVLDILQNPQCHNRSATLPDLRPSSRAQKLPFDTSSLRNLVVRAGVVTRALKEVIRKAEGVDPNPQDIFPSDPPFRRIFDQPSQDDFASFEAALAEMH